MPKAKFADRGKTKPKSVKSKAKLSSKRKLSRFGKEQKKGHAGVATTYITRTRAIKKLQLTLRDFRRLCILKGIYPREPRKKTKGHSQTYYHYKDIKYLSHEPLLAKFQEFKTFMRKVRKAAGRDNLSEARRLYAKSPKYKLDHLVKERYPRFSDALADLDDALSMVHMFAGLPCEKQIQVVRTESAKRISREWQAYVMKSKTLRKVFLSIKGVYFQADVQGQEVVWLLPWQFSQRIPDDVDFRVMLTFLEFHEVLMKFVLFKLYHTIGLKYPPVLRTDLEEKGAVLSALKLKAIDDEKTSAVTPAAPAASAKIPASKDLEESIKKQMDVSKSRIKSLGSVIKTAEKKSMKDDDESDLEDSSDESSDESDDEKEPLGSGFEDTEEGRALAAKAKEQKRLVNLFKGFKFFLSREVPRELFEFVIRSFSGKVGWEGEASPYSADDPAITHMIVDRPNVPTRIAGREYLQPQWVIDCINAATLLPVSRYALGAELPPHLSPFVDDAAVGYIPAYRKELDQLKAAAGAVPSTAGSKHAVPRAGPADEDAETDSDEEAGSASGHDDDESDDEEARRYAEELEKESKGVSFSGAGLEESAGESEDDEGDSESASDEDDEEGDEEDDEDDEGDEDEDEEDAKPAEKPKRARGRADADVSSAKGGKSDKKSDAEKLKDESRRLAASMLTNKQKKLYTRVVASKNRSEKRVKHLTRRREDLESNKLVLKPTGVLSKKSPEAAPGGKKTSKRKAKGSKRARE